MRLAIIVRPDDASPKVLAISLQKLVKKCNVDCDIFYEHGFLMRRVSLFGKFKQKGKLHFTLKRYLRHYIQDRKLISRLKGYDAVIISDCEPNGFWKHHFGIEKLRRLLKKPIVFHEVYYIGNIPSHLEKLRKEGHPTIERYDWHLAVTDVTEIKTKPKPPWSLIGLNLQNQGLEVGHKTEFLAIVDFKKRGYEKYRAIQIEALEYLNIPYISFEKRMSIDEIRGYYRRASLIFLSFPETFGVPIAECLACGTAIFTPYSSWPMSWRLQFNPVPSGKGDLPECFYVYEDKIKLIEMLKKFINNWDAKEFPKSINKVFKNHYSSFYYGNKSGVDEFIDLIPRLKENILNK